MFRLIFEHQTLVNNSNSSNCKLISATANCIFFFFLWDLSSLILLQTFIMSCLWTLHFLFSVNIQLCCGVWADPINSPFASRRLTHTTPPSLRRPSSCCNNVPDHSWKRLPRLEPTDSSHHRADPSLGFMHESLWGSGLTEGRFPAITAKRREEDVCSVGGMIVVNQSVCVHKVCVCCERTVKRHSEHNRLKENFEIFPGTATSLYYTNRV